MTRLHPLFLPAVFGILGAAVVVIIFTHFA
jgi:hypothetical protein